VPNWKGLDINTGLLLGNLVKPYTLETSDLPKFARYLRNEGFSLAPVECFAGLRKDVQK
jgi:hypothetical protein